MKTGEKTETCAACAYWNEQGNEAGECRRHPPQAISLRVDDEVKFETRFPVTQASDWCGEFTRS